MLYRLIVILAGLTAAVAQVLPVGTVDGTIHDSSGGAVPGMKVTLTHLETNQVRTAQQMTPDTTSFPWRTPDDTR